MSDALSNSTSLVLTAATTDHTALGVANASAQTALLAAGLINDANPFAVGAVVSAAPLAISLGTATLISDFQSHQSFATLLGDGFTVAADIAIPVASVLKLFPGTAAESELVEVGATAGLAARGAVATNKLAGAVQTAAVGLGWAELARGIQTAG